MKLSIEHHEYIAHQQQIIFREAQDLAQMAQQAATGIEESFADLIEVVQRWSIGRKD